MRKCLIEKFKDTGKGSPGYTLTELLAVIGIIAVLCAIAIPSIITINRALKFRQRDDYAKTIFLAAQANLSEMRSDGSLSMLQGMGGSVSGCSDFPSSLDGEYVYVTSAPGDTALYSLVLPVNSVESTLRNKQVIIEYNPRTGNVYAVFYSEEEESIFAQYTGAGLPRNDKAARRSMMLGYYDGSGLLDQNLEPEQTKAELVYNNGEEGILAVKVPMPSEFYANWLTFANGLSVELIITGDTSGGEITVTAKTPGDSTNCSLDIDGKTVIVEYSLDSLVNGGSFANKVITDSSITSLTKVASESGFTILPGENVTVQAQVKFTSADAAVEVESGILPGINPLFEYLEPSTSPDKYILAVSNGRNLQNLNVIAPSVAAKVDVVVFTDDVDWNVTVQYYNHAYGNGGTYANSMEAPARCLPYFVPINNQNLFGSAYFNTDTLPVMQDKHDATAVTSSSIRPADHADIVGDGHRVLGLNIDATKYDAQTSLASYQEYYVSNDYSYRNANNVEVKVTNYQRVDYYFAGLFAYANTNIDGLDVVNPIVKGYCYTSDANITTAAGALLGASGYNTLVTNCGVYIDKNADGYKPEYLSGPFAYSAGEDQTWYGVSGQGSVGGLVGYAKSHRTASGNLTDDTSELAFSYCFAAVPVSGDMRGNNNRNYGYTNGVGGFIGNSELTNFYSCYSSGDVLATGCFVQKASTSGTSNGIISGGGGIANSGTMLTDILQYDGRYSMGAGGFVGVSHGTRYTNCFTTGDVIGKSATANGTAGAGGFVGIMCYDEGFNYNVSTNGINASERIEQLTVFDSCYSTGKATIDTQDKENFSGANARIYTYSCAFYVDYYKLFAPYYRAYGIAPSYPSTNDADSNQKNDAYYIYKDSYYLSRNFTANTINIYSNDCASVASYDLLTNLPGNHNDPDWLSDRVMAIGAYTTAGGSTYIDYYGQSYWTGTLTPLYKNQLQEGFPWVNWRSAISRNTHPYTLSAGTYPFSKLNNMDYYGDWPTRPLECGLAYYEDYASDGADSITRGIFFDSEDTSTLKNREKISDYTLVSDGYAILSANQSDTVVVTVEGSGNAYTLTATSTFTPGAEYGTKSFAVFPLNKAIMEEAAKAVTEDNFYVKLTVNVAALGQTSKTYTMYFNPNTAKSNVNPSSGTEAEDPGDAVPDQILIRTARQLAALSTATGSWGEDCRYVQELDIEFASYTADSYGASAADICTAIAKAGPIGSAEKPFNASYNGSENTVIRDVLKETDSDGKVTSLKTSPLFGVIGSTGSVRNLTVKAGTAEGTVTIGSAEDETIGIVANVVNGTLDNVELILSGPVAVSAKTNAGLAVGLVDGTLKDGALEGGMLKNVSVTSGTAAAVQAINAGGVVGSCGENANVTGCCASFTSALTLTGAHCGGFAGSASGTAEGGNVTLTDLTAYLSDSGFAGGYAGIISGGTVKTTVVTLSGTNESIVSEGGSVLGGFAGSAENVVLAASSVTLNASGSLKAQMAAGFVGNAAGLTVQNSKVNALGKISGTLSAAGFAGSMDDASKLSICSADIRGSIEAPTAAGFAVTAGGTSSTCTAVLKCGRIIGTAEAAGFAGSVSGTVDSSSGVVGSGSISAPKAAGFVVTVSGKVAASRVTPAYAQSQKDYAATNYSALTVTGKTAAGFVVTVESGALVMNSDALGTITGEAVSCFADTNAGSIDGCMANVVVAQNSTFVRDNQSGTVSYCYGWYGDGVQTDLANFEVGGQCYGSYFVDIDVWEEGENNSVLLYTAESVKKTTVPSDLSSYISELNGSAERWSAGGTFYAYPFSQALKTYPFPMLRVHSGNWVGTPQYAYGVIYYEKYADDTLKYHVVDLSDPLVTVDKKSLSIAGNFTADGSIAEAGYAVFCKNVFEKDADGNVVSTSPANPFTGIVVGKARDDLAAIAKAINTLANAENRYGVFTLDEEGQVTLVGSDGGSVSLVTWYADAINVKDNTYQIRTGEQFSNIRYLSASNFRQTHNIALGETYGTIDTLSGTFDGNGYSISAGAVPGLIGTVGGTVTNLKLTADSASGSIFGTVSDTGTVQNSEISVGTAGSSIIGTVRGVVQGNTLSIDSAGVSGTDISFGIAASQVTSDGKLTNNVITGAVNVTGTDQATATIGGIAGVNAGEISGGYANVKISYTQASADNAVIGGLAGRMDGGSIHGVNAYGEVNLLSSDNANPPSASGRSYIIGGVIGKDNGENATYSSVSSEVTVDSNWAGSVAIQNAQDPMGCGPVGMFVGYAGQGSFDTCSSTAKNTTYQFLGQIAVSTGVLPASGDTMDWFSYSTAASEPYSCPAAKEDTLEEVADANDFLLLYDSYPYTVCTAELNKCTFLYDSNTYTQTIQPTEYFYLGELQSTEGGYQQTEVKLKDLTSKLQYEQASNVTYIDLYSGSSSVQNYATGYYYKVSEEQYKEVLVTVSKSGGWYTYTIYAGGNPISQKVDNKGREQPISTQKPGSSLTLYKVVLNLSGGSYLITNTENTYYFDGTRNGVLITRNEDGCMTNETRALWNVSGNIWTYGNQNLYLNNSTNLTSGSYSQSIMVSPYNDSFSLSGYYTYGQSLTRYYLRENQSNFSSSKEESAVRLWTVEEVAASRQGVFTYQNLLNLSCQALDADKNPLVPATEASAINVEETAESAAEAAISPSETTGGDAGNTGA